MGKSQVSRHTNETDVVVDYEVDDTISGVDKTKHNIVITANGDFKHHLVEDIMRLLVKEFDFGVHEGIIDEWKKDGVH